MFQAQLPLLFVINQNTAGQFPSQWENVCILIEIGFGFIQRKFDEDRAHSLYMAVLQCCDRSNSPGPGGSEYRILQFLNQTLGKKTGAWVLTAEAFPLGHHLLWVVSRGAWLHGWEDA